ncbi:hypothetical protein Tco_1235629 [Tanacetum coccineum]
MVKPVWNNAQRVNHQNFAKKTHPYAKKNMVPRAVLMKYGLVSVNTARQITGSRGDLIVDAHGHEQGHMSISLSMMTIDGGYVAFGGNPKGGKITGKSPKDYAWNEPSDPSDNVADEAVHKELGDSLVRAAHTSYSLECRAGIGGGPRCQETMRDTIAQTRFKNGWVKKLEKKRSSRTHKLKRLYKVGLSAKVESFGDEESLGEDDPIRED